ncbi:MAG TPA: hypothetical protein PKA38_04415 [Candidatus Levybacteria bacterium]|nr:hypothetical protein [Candidatus Levybacteria bacterium]
MTNIEAQKGIIARNELIPTLDYDIKRALNKTLHNSSLNHVRDVLKGILGTDREHGAIGYASGKVFEAFAHDYLYQTQSRDSETVLTPQLTANFFLKLHPEVRSKRGFRFNTWYPSGVLIEHSDQKKTAKVNELYKYALTFKAGKKGEVEDTNIHIAEVKSRLLAKNGEPYKRARDFLSTKFNEKDLMVEPATDLMLRFIVPSDISRKGLPEEMVKRLPIKYMQFMEFYKTDFLSSIK